MSLALLTTPGQAGTVRVGPAPPQHVEPGGGVRLRALEVGVCGTDREIADGAFGVAPPGEADLVLGHELLGEVLEDGRGFSAGDLVTATVRRSCGRCAPCAAGAPDACATGDYTERGITALHGFAREVLVERPEHLVPVPASLGRLGVLAEPASVCARALRHARAIGGRQPWAPARALVLGAGTIGLLTTCLLRLDHLEVWTSSLDTAQDRLVRACGAEPVLADDVRALRDEVGGFDVVVEAAGDAELMLSVLGLLRRNGVGCLLGLDAHHDRPVSIGSRVVGVDAVLGNRVLFGSVNAHRDDWRTAVAQLDAVRARWPDVLEAMIGLRVPPDRFADAFAFRGVKATLDFT